MKQRIVNTLAFLAIWAMFLLACEHICDGLLVHEAVASSLRGGTGWGRAMLAGSWQFPPLPSLAMLIMQYLANMVHIGAGRLYASFFQSWVVWQLIMLCGWRRCWCVLLPLFLPAVFKNLCVLEAGWLAAALFTAGLCAFVRWQESHSLREVMLGGVFFGLMALCGVLPAMLGLAGVLWFWYCARPGAGLRTLLWSVWAYCLLLILLWNWLVMGKPFFAFHGAVACISKLGISSVFSQYNTMPASNIYAIFFPLAPMCIYASKSSMKKVACYMVFCLLALLLYFPCCLACSIPMTAGCSFFCALILSMCALAGCASFEKPVSRNAAIAALCLSLAYSFVPRTMPCYRSNDYATAPDRQEITDFIDRLWPDSRTLLYGMELPALYLDTQEKRFLARIEYSQEELLEYGEQEQMHLLLPPPYSGLFPKDSRLEEIYEKGAPWLFLEKKWDNGWKLWRVIRLQ